MTNIFGFWFISLPGGCAFFFFAFILFSPVTLPNFFPICPRDCNMCWDPISSKTDHVQTVWVVLIKTSGSLLEARHAKLGAILVQVIVTPPGAILAPVTAVRATEPDVDPRILISTTYHMSHIGFGVNTPVSQVEIGSLSTDDNGDSETVCAWRGSCCHLGIWGCVWLTWLPSWTLFPSTCDGCVHKARCVTSLMASAWISALTATVVSFVAMNVLLL